jgi:hypothetical protein
MGNIIISNDFVSGITAGDVHAISTATGYDVFDIFDNTKLKRRWRMDSADKSDHDAVIIIDMESAQTVTGVVLDDVNFNKVIIKGNDYDLSGWFCDSDESSGFYDGESDGWDTASFSSGEIDINVDAQVNRRKVFIPLTGFNYRYMAIIIPTSATAVGSYTAKWEIGRLGVLDSYYTFVHNVDWGYQRGASRMFREVPLGAGGYDRVSLGDIRWEGTLPFTGMRRQSTSEVDLTTLNNLDIGNVIVFYENDGDTSKVYFCFRDTNYIGTYKTVDGVAGNSIRLKETV